MTAISICKNISYTPTKGSPHLHYGLSEASGHLAFGAFEGKKIEKKEGRNEMKKKSRLHSVSCPFTLIDD